MGKIREGANRATPSEAASFVEEVDRLEQDRENRLDQIDAEFKKKKRDLNKSINSDIKAVCDEAKKVGVQKGVIKAIVASQKRMRKHSEALEAAKEKAADSLDALEDEQRDFAKDIVQALGDDFAGFGLGAAAVEKANGKPKQPDAAGIAAEMSKQDAAKGAAAAKH
jgi:uncharacterized protein (UPF0335 family)